MASILFIDDDAGGREMAAYILRAAGHEVDEAESGEAGIERLAAGRHDLVVTDVRMPGLSGIEVTRRVRALSSDTAVVVVTAYGKIETAVEAMKAGADDFVVKPFSREQLQLAIDRALERRRLARENRELRRKLRGVERPIIGDSAAMVDLLAVADRVAPSDASVLVVGESGTGKELVARRIHARSQRADAPFVAVNCAAIPDELIEAELFGHEAGAFTGATRARAGRFRQAEGGTLFLDEVAELPLAVQGTLLRVLQEHTVDVVGADKPVAVDVRVIAASNRDLHAEVEANRFREDLFYRLNVVEIPLPPLRDRREDIPSLARHFVAEFAGGRELHVPADVIAAIERRAWPGNVRQLRNACERLVALAQNDTLSVEDLPPGREAKGPAPAEALDTMSWPELPPDGLSLIDLEKSVIERALALKGGNISDAARYLHVPRHFLVYRIEKYGIERARKK